jgi:hypothetical protein
MKKLATIFCLPAFLLLLSSADIGAKEMSNSFIDSKVASYLPEGGELTEAHIKKLANTLDLQLAVDHAAYAPRDLQLTNGIDWFFTDNFFINLDTILPVAETLADTELAGKAEADNELISMKRDSSSYIDLDTWIISAGIQFHF